MGGAYAGDGGGVEDSGVGGAGVRGTGGVGDGGFSASAVSHAELDRGRGAFPPAFSQDELAGGRGCRSEPVRLPTLHTPCIVSWPQMARWRCTLRYRMCPGRS
jgi:hypothetical protein